MNLKSLLHYLWRLAVECSINQSGSLIINLVLIVKKCSFERLLLDREYNIQVPHLRKGDLLNSVIFTINSTKTPQAYYLVIWVTMYLQEA